MLSRHVPQAMSIYTKTSCVILGGSLGVGMLHYGYNKSYNKIEQNKFTSLHSTKYINLSQSPQSSSKQSIFPQHIPTLSEEFFDTLYTPTGKPTQIIGSGLACAFFMWTTKFNTQMLIDTLKNQFNSVKTPSNKFIFIGKSALKSVFFIGWGATIPLHIFCAGIFANSFLENITFDENDKSTKI